MLAAVVDGTPLVMQGKTCVAVVVRVVVCVISPSVSRVGRVKGDTEGPEVCILGCMPLEMRLVVDGMGLGS